MILFDTRAIFSLKIVFQKTWTGRVFDADHESLSLFCASYREVLVYGQKLLQQAAAGRGRGAEGEEVQGPGARVGEQCAEGEGASPLRLEPQVRIPGHPEPGTAPRAASKRAPMSPVTKQLPA